MPEAGVSFRYFLPAPALRAAITTDYVLEVSDAPIEELLFPEWANIRLLLDSEWSQTCGDGPHRDFSAADGAHERGDQPNRQGAGRARAGRGRGASCRPVGRP